MLAGPSIYAGRTLAWSRPSVRIGTTTVPPKSGATCCRGTLFLRLEQSGQNGNYVRTFWITGSNFR